MQYLFDEEHFCPRTKDSYNKECQYLEEASNDILKNKLSTLYGINERSALTKLPDFDVTVQLPQDLMHTVLEGVLQYEIRLVLNYFISNNFFTLVQLNAAIINHNYGYSEVGDKPGPLKETVFNGKESYKLKYNAAQARLFLRLLPFFISNHVDAEDEHFLFLIELSSIVNLLYAPIIKIESIQVLRQLIREHLHKFTTLFEDVNILPKQHYLIHLPTMITQLGPLIRSSCFAFESAHNYFKQLAPKQNFKNLIVSLATRHQFLECANFGDGSGNPAAHPLFSTEKKLGVLKRTTNAEVSNLRSNFDKFSLLPNTSLENVCRVSWIILHGTKYCNKGIIAVTISMEPALPIFGKIKEIWIIQDFVYFEVSILETVCMKSSYQTFKVKCIDDEEIFICPYERLVDFNVYHIKKVEQELYIPIKYDIDDIVEEYAIGSLLLNN